MKASFEVSSDIIRELVFQHIREKLGESATPKPEDLKILVRSKQNYRDKQWEEGELSVKFEGEI